jgi:hypothetical protein
VPLWQYFYSRIQIRWFGSFWDTIFWQFFKRPWILEVNLAKPEFLGKTFAEVLFQQFDY